MSKKGKAKPTPKMEKSPVLPDMWYITPPEGYKFDLWSFGRYGLNLILRKKGSDR